MKIAAVKVWTVQYVHGKHDKFYRTYMIEGSPAYSVMQYGRNGTVGQFIVASGVDRAIEKRDEKMREGYTSVSGQFNVEMTVDLDDFQAKLASGGDRAAGEFLQSAYIIRRGGGINVPGQEKCPDCNAKFNSTTEMVRHQNSAHKPEVPEIPDRVGVLAEKAQKALSVAAEDPITAQVELVALREEREKIAIDLRRADSYLDTIDMMLEEADV